MSIAAPRKSTTRRTLLIAALGVLLLDAFAIVMFGGVGLNGFPGDVIKRALEPIVPYTVIDLGGDPTHVASLFDFYPSITGSIIMSWVVMAVIIVSFSLLARRLKEIPSGVQNAVEFAIEGLTNFAMGIGGPGAKRFITFFLACFLFISVSNWSGLIPGVGRVHEFRAPTSDVNVTVGLMQGIIFSVLVLVFTMLAMEGHHEEGHDEHHEPAPAGGSSAAGAESQVAAH